MYAVYNMSSILAPTHSHKSVILQRNTDVLANMTTILCDSMSIKYILVRLENQHIVKRVGVKI